MINVQNKLQNIRDFSEEALKVRKKIHIYKSTMRESLK